VRLSFFAQASQKPHQYRGQYQLSEFQLAAEWSKRPPEDIRQWIE
jgi:hypothetical protein